MECMGLIFLIFGGIFLLGIVLIVGWFLIRLILAILSASGIDEKTNTIIAVILFVILLIFVFFKAGDVKDFIIGFINEAM